MNKPNKQKEIKKELNALCHLIMILDGLRAFRRVQPETVKNAFMNLKSKDIAKKWTEIRNDVKKIVYMPLEIPKIEVWMKATLVLRYLFTISLIPSFLIFMSRFFSRSAGSLIYLDERIAAILIIFPLVIGQISIIFDYIVRRKVASYEQAHSEKYRYKREKIKTVTQMAIKKLAQLIRKWNEDPETYKLRLYFDDYDYIKVTKKSRGRIFKRSYYVYEATPHYS